MQNTVITTKENTLKGRRNRYDWKNLIHLMLYEEPACLSLMPCSVV